jgi:hypothetical protein
LSCLLVAGPLPSDLFLSAKYLRFAANEAVRSARPASLRSRVGAPFAATRVAQASSSSMIRSRWISSRSNWTAAAAEQRLRCKAYR